MTAMHTLEQLLKQLRLPHMAGAWQCQEKQALSEGWSPSRYLLSLCSEEAADRLIHHSYLFELQGESYRRKNSKALSNTSSE